MILNPDQLKREAEMIERYLAELPPQLSDHEQLRLVSATLGRTLGSIRDILDTLSHLASEANHD
jgi:hypothetical protein